VVTNGVKLVPSGVYSHAIDEKGRVAIPAKIRESLQRDGHDRIVITNAYYDSSPCLHICTPHEWDSFIQKLKTKNRFDHKLQRFEFFYVGNAHEVQVDKQGRILIPQRLREHARLERDVTFVTMSDKLQAWNTNTYEEVSKSVNEEAKKPEFYQDLDV